MEPDVVEIAPPSASSSKSRKQKQVAISEVIDVEQYESCNGGGSAPNINADTKNKGKAVQIGSYSTDTATDAFGLVNSVESYPTTSPGSHNMLDLESLIYEDDYEYYDEYNQYPDEAMDVDDYSKYQDLLDFKDIPTDVEVIIPWFQNSTNKEASSESVGSSSSHANNGKKSDVTSSSQEINNASGSPSLSPSPQMPASTSQPGGVVSHNSEGSKSLTIALPQNTQFDYISTYPTPEDHLGSDLWIPIFSISNGGTVDPFPVMPPQTSDMGAPPSGMELPVPPYFNPHASSNSRPRVEVVISSNDSSRVKKDMEAFLGKYLFFKRFDMVEDFSDHNYASKGNSSKQHDKSWAKRIQQEWKILENDLPDMIFVRAYESRMDLMRAVIIGAEGTPYHDGLFFFDIYFPNDYPDVPPLVHYHAGGLRINPNLYNSGKVCLSLLGTWSGHQKEKWIPKVSTMLQVLVSIQALILNKDPYFNEPGYEPTKGTSLGETKSKAYSENTFILSLKTMIYNMRRPPKHFEDFAYGHFFSCAHDILKACKAYKDGAPVGSLVNGSVKGTGASSSSKFRSDVDGFMKMLVNEFTILDVKGLDEATGKKNNNGAESEKSDKVKTKRVRKSRWI